MAAQGKQQAEAAEKNRVRKEFEDGYPTRETIAEFLDAANSGAEGAIKGLLKKRRAMRLNQTGEPASGA